MRLRILDRSRFRLSPKRWRDRSRRFAAVQSGLEALWSQGLALRMSMPEQPTNGNGNGGDNGNGKAPDDAQEEPPSRARAHAVLRQWQSYVGVFLHENLRTDRVPPEFAAEHVPADEERLAERLTEHGAEAVWDSCLAQLADVAYRIDDEDVLPAPRALDDAARTLDAPIESVLSVKIRGIPRID